MNIHITKNTRVQKWDGQTVFHEYPLFIRPGNFTVTLMFHDSEAMLLLYNALAEMIQEIDSDAWISFTHKRGSSLTGG